MGKYKKQVYDTKKWKKVRDSIRKKCNFLCQNCLKKGIISEGVEVHHIKWLNDSNINDDSIVYGDENLTLLCKECHFFIHKPKQKNSLSKFIMED